MKRTEDRDIFDPHNYLEPRECVMAQECPNYKERSCTPDRVSCFEEDGFLDNLKTGLKTGIRRIKFTE
jgi:hypothetical protein